MPCCMARVSPRDELCVVLRRPQIPTSNARTTGEKTVVVDLAPRTEDEQLANRLRDLGLEPTSDVLDNLRSMIVAVASWKGGVGKTMLAYELAWFLRAVLVDFDWDRGGISRQWGYRHETRTTAPLLDALESGKTPRPLRGGETRADLVPSHPDWSVNQPPNDLLASRLEEWAATWRRPVVVDTHPGGVPSTYGALAAAHLVVVPAPFGEREFEALEGLLDELQSYPLLIVPNMVPSIPVERDINRLADLGERYNAPIGPMVSEYRWLRRRQRRMAVSSTRPVPKRAQVLVNELSQVTKAVVTHVRAAA